MSKQELIRTIRQHNPTANADYLTGFDKPALLRYLRRLRHGRGPRGADSFWTRRPDTPAIVWRAAQ